MITYRFVMQNQTAEENSARGPLSSVLLPELFLSGIAVLVNVSQLERLAAAPWWKES